MITSVPPALAGGLFSFVVIASGSADYPPANAGGTDKAAISL